MRSIRLIIITISLLTAGLIVLPETVSVFLGKHNWYNLDASPASDVPCQKCHADIYEELNLSDLHIRWGDPAKADTAAPTPPTGNFIAYSEPGNSIYYNNRV